MQRQIRTARTPAPRPAARTVRTVKRNYYGEVCDQLQLIAELEAEEQDLSRRRQELEQGIRALMDAGELTEVDDGAFQAKITTPAGKASRTIDPDKFYDAVSTNDFWASISVGVTAAKQYLTDAEIDKISNVVPGVPGEPKLTISPVKKGKK